MISFHCLRFLCMSLLLSSRTVTAQSASTTQCESDTELLNAKVTSMNLKVVEPDLSCSKTSQPTCTFDYGPLNSNYVTACTNTLQGVVNNDNMVMECIVPGTTTKRTFYFDNSPRCYPQSCNAAAIDYETQTILYPLLENQMKDQLGLECDLYEKSAGSDAVNLIANFAVSGIIFFFVMIQSYF